MSILSNDDEQRMLTLMEFMGRISLDDYDEIRTAIGNLLVASANLDRRRGHISRNDHDFLVGKVNSLMPHAGQVIQ